MNRVLIGILLLSMPILAHADGTCSYKAYEHCYAYSPLKPLSDRMIRAMCFVNSTQKEGVYGVLNLNECKQVTHNLGQMVELDYYDLQNHKHSYLRVYPRN